MKDLININLNKLKKANIPNPEIDLRVIISSTKKIKNEFLIRTIDSKDIDIKKFNSFINRRLQNEPISKIINKKNFWKDDFYVDTNVLDPRPETEGIIEASIDLYKNKEKELKIIDIGTGSGAISISLVREFKNAKILATDISENAIKIAKKNIFKKKLQNNIKIKKIPLNEIKSSFDLIVSNPPYLSELEYQYVSKDIKNYEPKIALCAGRDGLEFYRELAKNVYKLIKKNGFLLIEIGENQLDECLNIFQNSKLKFEKKMQDLQKKDRILLFSKL